MKKWFLIFFSSLFFLNCPDPHPDDWFVTVENNTNYEINATLEWSNQNLETSLILSNNEYTFIRPDAPNNKWPSQVINYIVIKNQSDVELMNLQGEAINNALIFVDEDSRRRYYLLEVND